MAKDKGIRLPSGQGGLTRYFEGDISKLEFSPGAIIVLTIIVITIIVLLHMFGGGMLG
jgi:preprotein translocase subunit Sec61beta